MTQPHFLSSVVALLLATSSSAHAERRAMSAGAPIAIADSPYRVELIGANGRPLEAHWRKGQLYTLGQPGARYSIRVHNPSSRRIEAVISVDGLDVIDGESASYEKRGYIVPAGESVTIDGYRVSTEEVAAFRFSSVASSYAGRKGKARNVGVIGVALFAEHRPLTIVPWPRPWRRVEPTPPHIHAPARGKDEDRRLGDASSGDRSEPASPSSVAPAPSGRASSATSESHTPAERRKSHSQRSGLGTAFGEHRDSAITWTDFRRAHPSTPTALAELRYNDRAGLRALGIRLRPRYDRRELSLRESADPFPSSPRFAQPPK